MDESKISDVVLTSKRDDHELSLPKLLVVWNLIMVGFTFTNLENSSVTLENDFNVLQLLGINTLKLEHELLVWNSLWFKDHLSLLENTWSIDILSSHVLQTEGVKVLLVLKVLEHWHIVIGVC